MNSKQATFAGTLEINGAGLKGIGWILDLLCEVEGIVDSPLKTVGVVLSKLQSNRKFPFCGFDD